MARLGLDFGTSNTAAGVMAAGKPFVIPLEQGQDTLPTAVFIDFADKRFVYGSAAARAMRDGQEGRFLRGLKSVLGTPLAQEKRNFLGQKLSVIDLVARFLGDIKTRSEAFTGMRFDHVVSGRPVRFHSASEERNAQAQVDLQQAYTLAGFTDISFLPEPEAAALAVEGEGRLLVVDIGGGTSDFTLCERDGTQTRVLASRGLRIGGTDFDKTLSLSHAMPLVGMGGLIGAEFGASQHPAPRAMFNDLATWEKIAFVYDAALLREVRRWIRLAQEPVLFERLAEVLEMHLGHDIAYAVEAGKITANGSDSARIALDVVARGLGADLTRAAIDAELAGFADAIGDEALATLRDADCAPDTVDQVVFVGGASLMGVVRHAISTRLPDTRQVDAQVFTAVVQGLAIAAGE